MKILIVTSRYYKEVSAELEKGAIAALENSGFGYDILEATGAFEIPSTIAIVSKSSAYSGYVALGCVIRGETTHYDYVCNECAHGLAELSRTHSLAIGFGVLTVENMAQAMERARADLKNKGAEAVKACLSLIDIKKRYGVD